MEINETGINFKTLKGLKGKINLPKLKWAIPNKKTVFDRFNVGDIIFVKEEKKRLVSKTVSKSEWRYSGNRPVHWRCKSFSWWI